MNCCSEGFSIGIISLCLIINLGKVGLVKLGSSKTAPGAGVVVNPPVPPPTALWNPAAAYWAISIVNLSPSPLALGAEANGGSTTRVLPLLSAISIVNLSPTPLALGAEANGGSTTRVLPLLSCERVQLEWV